MLTNVRQAILERRKNADQILDQSLASLDRDIEELAKDCPEAMSWGKSIVERFSRDRMGRFEFLGIADLVQEKELERQLIGDLKDLLLELGYGFTFVGQQYPLHLGEKNYRVDLLFFHRKLQCLVAFDLKVGGFKPEYAGKMNFYLELLDEQVRLPKENPSIGVILCAEKDDLEVEYALRISTKPMGVAEYQLSQQLPKELAGQLPSPEELREELKRAKR